MANDTYTQLNVGTGGDKMDETALDFGGGDIRKRPRIVITGDANTGELAAVVNTLPADDDYALVTRNIESHITGSGTHSVAAVENSTTLSASAVTRRGITIYNDSTNNLYLKFGATASLTDYSLKMEPYSYYETIPFYYTGIIDGIWDGTNGAARVTELTT